MAVSGSRMRAYSSASYTARYRAAPATMVTSATPNQIHQCMRRGPVYTTHGPSASGALEATLTTAHSDRRHFSPLAWKEVESSELATRAFWYDCVFPALCAARLMAILLRGSKGNQMRKLALAVAAILAIAAVAGCAAQQQRPPIATKG
jgi:hypothetical protein